MIAEVNDFAWIHQSILHHQVGLQVRFSNTCSAGLRIEISRKKTFIVFLQVGS